MPRLTRYPFKNRPYFLSALVVLPAFAMVILVWSIQSIRMHHIVWPFFVTSFCMILAVAWFAVFLPLITARTKDRAAKANYRICPSCGYDLAKITNLTACPECGLQADDQTLQSIWTSGGRST